MIYKNLRIVTHNQQFNGYIELDDNNNIVKIEHGDVSGGVDCKNKILMPGFIDTHTHGGYGFSFDEFDDSDNFAQKFGNYLDSIAKEGLIGFCATNVSLSIDKLESISKAAANFIESSENKALKYPTMVAWYFEGPFISKAKKGAHEENLIVPISERFLKDAKKLISIPIICAVAPEIPGNLDLVKKYSKKINFAIGHSSASYQQTIEAFDDGANRIIHLFNAMSGFDHRNTGIVNAVFNDKYPKNAAIEMIADGVHLKDEVIETVYKVVNENNLVIISDCLSIKGVPDGVYKLGNLPIEKKGNFVYLENSTTLAGSAMKYNQIVNHFKKVTGCTLSQLVKYTSYNNARNLKLPSNFGRLTINKPANIIIVDDEFNVSLNISNGKTLVNKI